MSIRILLVDDEKLERLAQRKMLENHRPDLRICGEAADGEAALELMDQEQPDLVCLDIQMPGKSGIDVVREMEHRHPKTRVIMITAYDTFDYAREVMKSGVREYLLKPVSESELLDSVDRMGKEIVRYKQEAKEKGRQEQRIEMSMSFMRANRILALLMDYHVDGMEEERLDAPLSKPATVVAISLRDEETGALMALREQINAELTRLNPGCLVGPVLGSHIPALLMANEEGTTPNQTVQSFISTINRKTGAKVLAGASSGVNTRDDFAKAYQEAVSALSDVKNNPGANFQFYQLQKEPLPGNTRFKEESELIERVKQGDEEQVLTAFQEYFRGIATGANYQIHQLKPQLDEFFIVLHRALQELGVDTSRFDPSVMTSITQLKEQAITHLHHVLNDVNRWRHDDMANALDQVRRYVDTHYRNGLSLDDVADFAGLSMYYVSKLFKERFGVSFTRYVTDLRLTEAKRMLADTSVSLKEIALELGYRDPNYFSRVFKKETGINPTAYRENARTNPGT